MKEFLVNINSDNPEEARKIVQALRKDKIIPKGATIYVGRDSSIPATQPPTARVEQVFRDEDSGETSTIRITS